MLTDPFFLAAAAVTFTPAAFSEDSEKFTTSIKTWTESWNRWPGQRDIFPWAHVSYLLPGGPFELPSGGTLAARAPQTPDQLTQ